MKPKSVDEYINSAPGEVQDKLRELRAAIKSAAPKALEKISYGIPFYEYKGRVVYFAYAKHHIGVYALPANLEEFKKELGDMVTSKATIQLPLDKKMPLPTIKRLVKTQIKINEEEQKK